MAFLLTTIGEAFDGPKGSTSARATAHPKFQQYPMACVYRELFKPQTCASLPIPLQAFAVSRLTGTATSPTARRPRRSPRGWHRCRRTSRHCRWSSWPGTCLRSRRAPTNRDPPVRFGPRGLRGNSRWPRMESLRSCR